MKDNSLLVTRFTENQSAVIKAHAAYMGESASEFVRRAVMEAMERDNVQVSKQIEERRKARNVQKVRFEMRAPLVKIVR